MDKHISSSRKNAPKLRLVALVAIVMLGVIGTNYFFKDFSNSISIDGDKIITSTVSEGLFEDFVNMTATLEPSDVYFLDAPESGRVETLFVETGDVIKTGDTLLMLANSELQLEVMQREAQLLEQYNNQQQTQIILALNDTEQQQQLAESNYRLNLVTSQFKRMKSLYDLKVIVLSEYEAVEAEYNFALVKNEIVKKAYEKNSKSRQRQLERIEQAMERISKSLDGVRKIIDKLVVTSPVDGKLSDFSIKQGETVEKGDDLGQIFSFRQTIIRAELDEFYMAQLSENLSGIATYRNEEYPITLQKIYPTVDDGRFKIDAVFAEKVPQEINKGSSIRLKINLNESTNSLLLPRGDYFNQTGGEWIFVKKDGIAQRVNIKLGRSNPKYYEVLEGLKAGQEVITSSYADLQEFNTVNIK